MHLDIRISPNRFHQLSKTKIGLSEGRARDGRKQIITFNLVDIDKISK
jgi:hypothetical protein